ncbi:hypothetical protein [Vibrio sp. 10N.222.54.F10]|uniref:hypothetical protein n=1 Tax=Vibrio sp. 10N.222.54.F10 TaxID=1884469 RepID=UPI000C8595DD|nr:hypothetical protein [Vibrio sp. 10N.222.54.F10]PMO20001.1 hypothetical protein BCT17_21520 [Vibrio sp. 10N.222.54.F10]
MDTRENCIRLRLSDQEKAVIEMAMLKASSERNTGKPRSRGADALREAVLTWASEKIVDDLKKSEC